MRTLLFIPLLALVAGCGDDLSSHEGIAEAKASAYEDLADVFDSIKDKSSAEAAESKLKEIRKRIDAADRAGLDVKEELKIEDMEEIGNKLAAAEKRKDEAFMKLVDRLQKDPAAQAAFDNAMR